MNSSSLDAASIISSVKLFVRENPELTALVIILILILDALYVYRMFKKVWRKSSRKADNTLHPENSHSQDE